MSLTQLLVPTYTSLLKAMSGWLDKAQHQMPGGEAEALLTARLAPDMFPLATQIRFACRQAQEAIHRLQRTDFPPSLTELLGEALNADEAPGSLQDARNRIGETLALLEALAPDALDIDPSEAIAHELPNGMVFDFTAGQYARDWALPQFYFHVMTAYAILRAQNVQIGKVDYIPHLLPFLRQTSDPKS